MCFMYMHCMCVCFVCLSLGNIHHCLIYCREVSIAGPDPLHLSLFLNGISTVPTASAISHFNDWRNGCVHTRVSMHTPVHARAQPPLRLQR